jgi:L-ribulose-5-phosphate 4-epimerase
MSHQEGVIKFRMDFEQVDALTQDEASAELCGSLDAWRGRLVQLAVLGQDPARYEGYGFGNISCALDHLDTIPGKRAFLISGTQTGALAHLSTQEMVIVDACYPEENRIVAHGPVRPSSEAMTHGALYALDPAIQWVMHGHSPEIWRAAVQLGLPETSADVPYGTPEMSAEMARLWRESDVRERRILSMGGHEDGIVTFGATPEEAFSPWLDALAALG